MIARFSFFKMVKSDCRYLKICKGKRFGMFKDNADNTIGNIQNKYIFNIRLY